MMRHLVLPILLLTVFLKVDCQEPKLSEIIVDIAEDLAADETDPETVSLFIEQLHELSENPVRINSGDETDLSRLFFLTEFQIRSITDHVRSTGNIVSIYEIAAIPGFDRQITEMLLPFITLEPARNTKPDTLILRNTLLSNLIVKPGESDTTWAGSSWKILSRYKISAGPFSAGITTEKDAGEKLLSGTPPLPDFLSGHICYTGRGIIRKLIAGDFSVRFGQGTGINTGMRTGSAVTASGYQPGRDQIKPYTSTDENNFFRGAAGEFAFKRMGLSLFYSLNNLDATTRLSDDSTIITVDNFYKTGLHNTSSLLHKKDAVTETYYGMNVTYNFSSLRIGFNWSESNFSLPVNSVSPDAADLYDFSGERNSIFSAYYNSLINRILLFGEISTNDTRQFALVQGITLRPSDRLTLNFLYRNYSPGFISFHGRGPGSNSITGNEHGILGNFTFEAAKHLFISAGCDISHFPWLKYRAGFPSMSKKQEIKIRYLPVEDLSFEISYNYRYSMTDSDEDQGIAGIEEVTSRTFKGIAGYSVNENLTLKTRIDFKAVEHSGSKGMLMLQDIVYVFRRIPASLWLRYCIFKTDDWDSRIYTYENDLLYSFSIPAYSGEGSRAYIMVKCETGNNTELRVKYGITSSGSPGNQSEGRDELRMQFRIWF